jgi:hypothetical protein
MRAAHYLIAVAIASGLPAAAMAQSTTPAPAYTNNSALHENHWFASGFIGSNFSASSDRATLANNANIDNNSSSNLEFGGQIGYMWNRAIGVEFLADITPTFGFDNVVESANIGNAGLVDDPRLNTYMVNAIASIPIAAGRFQPYVSGGFGGVSVVADVLDNVLDPTGSSSRASLTRMGADVGGGFFAFAGNVGIRGDVRYFHASTNNQTATLPADQLTENLLSGLSFWRANVGIAFRW